MESLSFKNVPIRIGADLHDLKFIPTINASFSTSNNLNQVKGLGYYNSYRTQFPSSNIINNFSIQYVVQDSDPIKPIINLLKTGSFEEMETYYINAGGLTLSGVYLDNFSMAINPLVGITAQANFVSFFPFHGQIGNKIQLNKIYPRWTGSSAADPSNTYNLNNSYEIQGTGAYLIDLFSNTGQFLRSNSAITADRIYIYDNNGNFLSYYYIRTANNSWVTPSLALSNYFTIQSGYKLQLLNRSNSPSLFKDINLNYIIQRSGADLDDRISGNIDANFLHGNSSSVTITPQSINGINEDSSEKYGLIYNFRAEYIPINILGRSYPKTVKYNGAIEELEITENLYRRILYTGDTRSISLDLKPICCFNTNYIINIDNAQSIISNGSSQNNGVVITTRKFTKQY